MIQRSYPITFNNILAYFFPLKYKFEEIDDEVYPDESDNLYDPYWYEGEDED